MLDLSIRDRHRLSRVIGLSYELISLDDIWTEEAQKPAAARGDSSSLPAVVDDINCKLLELLRDSAPLQRIFAERNEGELNERAASLLDEAQLESDVRARLDSYLKPHGGLSYHVRQSIKALRVKGFDEMETLSEEIEKYSRGEIIGGDLPKWARCAIIGAGMGAAAAAGNWAALASLAVLADNSGCFDV